MADDRHPTTGPDCDAVRAELDLLALDALAPVERAELLAHVDRCAGCRAELERAAAAVGAVLALVPEGEVPAGFVDGVVARAGAQGDGETDHGEAGVGEAGVAPRPPGQAPRRAPGAGRLVGLVAAVAAVVLVLAALTAALGTVFGSDEQAGPPTVTTTPVGLSVPLVTPGGDRAGSVAIGASGLDLVMVVDEVAAGVSYDCVVRTPTGDLVQVGSWTPRVDGAATWSVTLDPSLGPVDELLLVGPGETTLATARLA